MNIFRQFDTILSYFNSKNKESLRNVIINIFKKDLRLRVYEPEMSEDSTSIYLYIFRTPEEKNIVEKEVTDLLNLIHNYKARTGKNVIITSGKKVNEFGINDADNKLLTFFSLKERSIMAKIRISDHDPTGEEKCIQNSLFANYYLDIEENHSPKIAITKPEYKNIEKFFKSIISNTGKNPELYYSINSKIQKILNP